MRRNLRQRSTVPLAGSISVASMGISTSVNVLESTLELMDQFDGDFPVEDYTLISAREGSPSSAKNQTPIDSTDSLNDKAVQSLDKESGKF